MVSYEHIKEKIVRVWFEIYKACYCITVDPGTSCCSITLGGRNDVGDLEIWATYWFDDESRFTLNCSDGRLLLRRAVKERIREDIFEAQETITSNIRGL